MSAIVTLIQLDAVHIATDRGGFSSDNTLLGVFDKQHQIRGIPAVASMSGSWPAFVDLMRAIDAASLTSVDDLLGRVRDIVDAVCVEKRGEWKSLPTSWVGGGADFRLFIIGWSETRGPVGMLINHEILENDRWMLDARPTRQVAMTPAPSDPRHGHLLQGLALSNCQPEFVDSVLLDLLQTQRQEFGIAAGGVDISTVRAGGVTSRHVATWPDQIGRHVDRSAPLVRA